MAIDVGLRVASWNVREGLPDGTEDPADRLPALAALVALVIEQRVDVLALQDVDFDVIGRSAVLKALRTDTALEYIHAEPTSPSAFLPGYRCGLALASRWPVAGRALARLPGVEMPAGGVLAGTVEAVGARVTVVSVPAPPPGWQELSGVLDKLDDDPLVVCGALPGDLRDLLGTGHRPLASAIGDRPTHRGVHADDILYSVELAVSGPPLVLPSFSTHDLCVVTLRTG